MIRATNEGAMKKTGFFAIIMCLVMPGLPAWAEKPVVRPSEVTVLPDQTRRDAITGKPVDLPLAPKPGERADSAVTVHPSDPIKVTIDPDKPVGVIEDQPTARDAVTGEPVKDDEAFLQGKEKASVRDKVRSKMKGE